MIVLAVALAGGLGSTARFLVDTGIRARWPTTVPWSTLVINVSASLLLGLVAGWAAAGGWSTGPLAVLGLGLCGGYSTFSTAAVELVRLVGVRERRGAALYAAATLLLPVAAASLGFQLAR